MSKSFLKSLACCTTVCLLAGTTPLASGDGGVLLTEPYPYPTSEPTKWTTNPGLVGLPPGAINVDFVDVGNAASEAAHNMDVCNDDGFATGGACYNGDCSAHEWGGTCTWLPGHQIRAMWEHGPSGTTDPSATMTLDFGPAPVKKYIAVIWNRGDGNDSFRIEISGDPNGPYDVTWLDGGPLNNNVAITGVFDVGIQTDVRTVTFTATAAAWTQQTTYGQAMISEVAVWRGPVTEVSQPVQVTSDTYYERGQSVAYDGTDYWIFYGRSDTVVGNYQNSNPDTSDYRVYYKKAASIDALPAATATLLSGTNVTMNANGYLGETGAAYFGGEVWAFATIDVGANAELYGWYWEGSDWGEVGPIVTGLSDGSAHHDEVAHDGELFVVVRRGDDFYTTHSVTPKTGGWSTEVAVGSAGGLCHFFKDGSELYLAVLKSPAPRENQIFQYNSGTDSWTLIASASSTGWDPTLLRVGDDYMFVQAPWTSEGGGRQYLLAWSSDALDSTFFDDGSRMVSAGLYGTNTWIEMWPTGFTDNNGDSYLFFTSERNSDDPTAEITGNIWYLPVIWDVSSEHYTYIQNAVDAALAGDAIAVHPGTYDETINIDGYSGLTIGGLDRDTVVVQPSTTLSWALPGYPQYDSRQAGVRVVGSTDVAISQMTFDFDLVKNNWVHGILYWDSSGALAGNVVKNTSVPDASSGYYEIGSYIRAPSYTDASRASMMITGNEFADTGRLGVVTHQYVDATISDNLFYKTTDDFGYAIELGSESIGTISGNTIYGFDTAAASDGSESAGIYVENSFTAGSPAMTKTVSITGNNEVYDCQYALWIGNGFNGYAGDVDIDASITDNNFHDNVNGGIIIQDEDKEYGSSVTAAFQNNTITNNAEVGVFIFTLGDGDITASFDGDTISGHDYGVYLDDYAAGTTSSSYNVTMTDCAITGNTYYGVLSEYDGTTITATDNWWGDRTGPFNTNGVAEVDGPGDCNVDPADDLNTNAFGDPAGDYVDYCPWTECLIDSHCDDGLWCTGPETCSGDLCLDGDDPCDACQQCDNGTQSCGDWCIFDLDQADGAITTGDFGIFAGCFGACYSPPHACEASNFDGDGGVCVGTGDFGVFAGCFALTCPNCPNCWGPTKAGNLPDDAVSIQLVARRNPTPSDVADEPPTSSHTVGALHHFFVEVWATAGDSADGLAAVYSDISFDPRRMSVVRVIPGGAFGTFAGGRMDNTAGSVSALGGCLSPGKEGYGADSTWVRVATLEMRVLRRGPTAISAGPAGQIYGVSILNRFGNIDPELIDFGGLTVQLGELAQPVEQVKFVAP